MELFGLEGVHRSPPCGLINTSSKGQLVVSFYTPMPRVEHKDPSLKHSEEADGTDQEGEEEKTADHAQQLINNGSNVNKEGVFVNILECAIHATENRVPPCGEVAPKCTSTVNKYGSILLCEAQEASDPLGDAPKGAPNEESARVQIESTKMVLGTQKTCISSVDDAPISEKGGSE